MQLPFKPAVIKQKQVSPPPIATGGYGLRKSSKTGLTDSAEFKNNDITNVLKTMQTVSVQSKKKQFREAVVHAS